MVSPVIGKCLMILTLNGIGDFLHCAKAFSSSEPELFNFSIN